jgi:hypothetical protein
MPGAGSQAELKLWQGLRKIEDAFRELKSQAVEKCSYPIYWTPKQ